MARLPLPRRVVFVLVLAVAVAAPAAMGVQLRPFAEDRAAGFVAALISELRLFFQNLLGQSWEKEGCIIDPNGGCKPR